MAEFEVKVRRLEIEEHPDADALELARVGNYRAVVRKGQFNTGDLAAYIPEQAVLPDWLISELGLEGKLAGSKKNRVKATRLRGVLSQGLIYPLIEDTDDNGNTYTSLLYNNQGTMVYEFNLQEGDDVTDLLGIIKYEPPVPVHMSGEVFNAHGKTLRYDIEDIKKFPDAFSENDHVVFTEKIHGTWLCVGWHPDVGKIVNSKGLSAKGLAFKFNENNQSNLYLRALEQTVDQNGDDIIDRAVGTIEVWGYHNTPVYVLGEIYGKGVQDLSYGTQHPQVRFYDVHIGDQNDTMKDPESYGFLNFDRAKTLIDFVGGTFVPVLYQGPFSEDVMWQYTSGTETVSGNNFNLREGIVIRTTQEAFDVELGRMIAKNVSEDYLLRKNATEYN